MMDSTQTLDRSLHHEIFIKACFHIDVMDRSSLKTSDCCGSTVNIDSAIITSVQVWLGIMSEVLISTWLSKALQAVCDERGMGGTGSKTNGKVINLMRFISVLIYR